MITLAQLNKKKKKEQYIEEIYKNFERKGCLFT